MTQRAREEKKIRLKERERKKSQDFNCRSRISGGAIFAKQHRKNSGKFARRRQEEEEEEEQDTRIQLERGKEDEHSTLGEEGDKLLVSFALFLSLSLSLSLASRR